MRVRLIVFILLLASQLPGRAQNRLDMRRVAEGRFVYEANCLVCHGKYGDGKGEMGTTVIPLPRDFRRGIFKFRSTPSGSLPTDQDIMSTIRKGIAGTAMPTFAHLEEKQIQSVTDYIKTFSNRWRKPENYADQVSIPEPPAWLQTENEGDSHLKNGKELYQAICSSCHGEDGSGKTETKYIDTWGHPLKPADLRLQQFKAGREPQDIYRALVTGLDGTPMPSFKDVLQPVQLWEIIAYVRSIRSGTP